MPQPYGISSSQDSASNGHSMGHPDRLCLVTVSDCEGMGATEDSPQEAWQVFLADSSSASGHRAGVSPISHRSCCIRRVVASTVGGEAIALSSALAECEWLQVLARDVLSVEGVSRNW